MVDVTVLNFMEKLPEIEKAINSSNFIAIDTEFTGLNLGAENNARLFDTLQERYLKLRDRASKFVPCQIGVTTFSKLKSNNMYQAQTFTFYIRPHMCGNTDKRFMLQASCIDFLNKYDFDFNKFLRHGIPYVNEFEEQQLYKEIEEGTIGHSHSKLIEPKLRREIDMVINNAFLNRSDKNNLTSPTFKSNDKLAIPKDKISHEYFQLREIRRKYLNLWAYMDNDMIIIKNVLPHERIKLEQACNEKNKLIDFYLGFRKVFCILKDAKKPIIGHNLLMDLLLFFHNFHKPLPDSYKKFKEEMKLIFPIIYDTRHIWMFVKKFYKLKEIPIKCGLFDLYEMFQNTPDGLATLYSPNVEHQNCEKYSSGLFPHESGFDSYITGWVFLKICHVLALQRVHSSAHIQPQSFSQYLKAVSPFENKLNLGGSNIRYIDISGEDPASSVPDFLHISSRRKTSLNLIQLSKAFEQYGLVEFKLTGKTTAIMAVGNIRSFKEILKDFKDDPVLYVTKYKALKHSAIVKNACWLTIIASCGIMAVLISRHVIS